MENFRTGKTGPTLASVVARVDSVEKWEAIPGVDSGVVLGATEDGKGWIVTGRFQIDRIDAVRSNEHVLSLCLHRRDFQFEQRTAFQTLRSHCSDAT
jgi:hypothetical protein